MSASGEINPGSSMENCQTRARITQAVKYESGKVWKERWSLDVARSARITAVKKRNCLRESEDRKWAFARLFKKIRKRETLGLPSVDRPDVGPSSALMRYGVG